MGTRNDDPKNFLFHLRWRLRFSRRLRNRSLDRFRFRRFAVLCKVFFVRGSGCDDLPIEFEADVSGTKTEVQRSLRFPDLHGLDVVRSGMQLHGLRLASLFCFPGIANGTCSLGGGCLRLFGRNVRQFHLVPFLVLRRSTIFQVLLMLKNAYRNLLLFLVSPCRISLTWVPWVICIVGFGLSIYFNYPGFLNHDATAQYVQMMSGTYGDWHPPIMAATWKCLKVAFNGVTGIDASGRELLWLFYTGLIWTGILSVLRAAKTFWQPETRSIIFWFPLFLLLFFLGWILYVDLLETTRSILKDAGMLGSYLIATGFLLNWKANSHWKWIISCCILLFLFYGTALRHNAIFAVFPLLFWLVWLHLPRFSFRRIFCVSVTLWVIMLFSIHFLNYGVLKTVKLYPLQERFYADIFYLNAFTDKFQLPPNGFGRDFSCLNEKLFREQYRSDIIFINHAFKEINENVLVPYDFTINNVVLHSPEVFNQTPERSFVFPGLGNRKDISITTTILNVDDVKHGFSSDYALLKKAWWNRVCSQPVDYLKIKSVLFWNYCKGVRLNFLRLNSTFLFLVIAWVVFLFSLSKDRMQPKIFPFLMLAWSAVLYVAPLWMFLTAETPRYLWWPVAASLISLVLLCTKSELIRTILKLIVAYWETKLRNTAHSLK